MQQSQNKHWRERVKPGSSFYNQMLPYAAGAVIGATLTAALIWGTHNAGRTGRYSSAPDSQQQAAQQENYRFKNTTGNPGKTAANVQQKKEQQGIQQQTYTQPPTTAAKEIYVNMTIDEMKSYPIADDWKHVSGVHIKLPTSETVVISTRSKRETADKSYGTVMYLFDKNGKIDYDLARTVGAVSENARQWTHYLYEGRPEDFHRKVMEFAGNETIANLAIYKTLAELENEAVARAGASVELAKFIQNPVPYLGIKFVQEFAREWEKEKYKGITPDNQGNYWLDIDGGSQKGFRSREEAFAYKQRLKQQENAPTSVYSSTEETLSGRKTTTLIGSTPKTATQWETERRVQQDPVYRTLERVREGRGSEAVQDIRRGAGNLMEKYKKAAPADAVEWLGARKGDVERALKPPERPAEGQRSTREESRPKSPDMGKIIGDILKRK